MGLISINSYLRKHEVNMNSILASAPIKLSHTTLVLFFKQATRRLAEVFKAVIHFLIVAFHRQDEISKRLQEQKEEFYRKNMDLYFKPFF